MRINLSVAAAVLGLAFAATHASAQNLLTNSDFETFGADSSTTTFPGWNEGSGTTAIVQSMSNSSGTALSGLASARIVAANSTMTQGAPFNISTPFSLDMKLAGTAVTGSNSRSTSFFLQSGSNTAYQVNLRVVNGSTTGKGTLEVYNGTAFVPLLADAFNFSTDLNTPVTNTLNVSGTFTPSASSYAVTLNGTQSSPISLFQNGRMTDLRNVIFSSINGAQTFVVDDVTLTPEPSSLALLGGLAFLFRRPRRELLKVAH